MRSRFTVKLLRDLARHRGQVIAIWLVVACGVATYIAMRSSYRSLLLSREVYYTEYRFADVFASLKRAPESLLARLSAISGVVELQTRIVRDVTLDVPGLDEPASARLIAIPENGKYLLNGLFLREGSWPSPEARDDILIGEAFAAANRFKVGDRIGAALNGRRRALRVAGIELSPEFVYEVQGGGALFPDNRRFGVFWMGRQALASAFDLQGAFNDISFRLVPGASEAAVIADVDAVLSPYGGLGAYGREQQV